MSAAMKRDALPARSTRGKRMQAALDDEEEAADETFWNQEFFKEEAEDNDYKTESEPEDIIDSDFDNDEEEEDDDEVEVKDDQPRKKALKPPGYKAKPKPKPKPKARPKDEDAEAEDEEEEADADDEEGEDGEGGGSKRSRAQAEPIVYVAPTLRRSTVAKVADAEMARQWKKEEKSTRKRPAKESNSSWRPLTQSEMLAEAALNEIENTRSLKLLLAREEETKKQAQVVKKKNTGPIVRFRSRKDALGEEKSTLELLNTVFAPAWLLPAVAPPPPDKSACAITGLPARYIDHASGMPLANKLASQRLRSGAGALAPSLQQQLVLHHRLEEQQRAEARQKRPREALLPEWRAQRQRREELVARASAVAAAAAHAAPPVLPAQGTTLDVMALVVDLRRSLGA